MARFIRRSILKGFLFVVFCTFLVCLPAQMVFAQRPIAPTPHPGGVPAHAPVPIAPITRPQVFQPPVIRSPILYPSTPAFRNSAVQAPGAFGRTILFPPRRPIHPRPPLVILYSPQFVFGTPFWGFGPCWSTTCDGFWPWTFSYNSFSSPGPVVNVPQVYETPIYDYGEERPLPRLYLKDGTIVSVTDYWLVDDQLHFTIQEDDEKPAEQTIPFDELDLQKTVDANTRRGFRFVLRNEPFEQYLRDHPDGAPPAIPPSQSVKE